MEQQIEADAPLDYVDLRTSPPNNYDVFICRGEVEEKVGCSSAEHILAYLSPTGSLLEKSDNNIRLQLPRDLEDNMWFTKATLVRVLKMIDSSDALKKMVALNNEISQLEETRGFHLSLYSQAEKRVQSSDDSKNELLRAMDLRLTALREELTTSFNQAAGEACSHKEMEGLEKFSGHFGHIALRSTFCKLLGVSKNNSKVGDSLDCKNPPVLSQTRSNSVKKITGNMNISLPSNVDQPVKYGASPAKAAQAERKSSSDSEESSNSSEEESQPSAERSRSLTRSATPRRSASPMRRVQIGKAGPRRTPAIAIKSLSYFPGRLSSRDAGEDEDDDNEEDGSERARITQSNARRMSVQDAISLFEKKQKDQSTDVQPKKSQDDKPVKPVLRRWSSGMGESSAQLLDQSTPENKVETISRPIDETENSNVTQRIQQERGPSANLSEAAQALQTDGQFESGDVGSFLQHHKEVAGSQEEGTSGKLDSAVWSKQKEEELNQMLVKFALCKPTSKYQKVESEDSKKPGSQKGKTGLIQYKDQRKQRIQGDNNTEKKTIKQAVKKTDKQGPTRTVRKSLDKTSKNETSLPNVTGVAKKQVSGVTQKEKVVKRSPLASNAKRELPQKTPPKPSPLPATRKSWPSAPSPVTSRTVATRTPPSITSSGIASSRQKGQLSAPLSRSASKVELPQSQGKDARKNKVENKRTPKSVDENTAQMALKVARTTKARVISASDENTPKVPVKPGVRKSMVTKRSSVVPLESKASNNSPRKAPAASPAKSTTPKRRGSPSVKEPPSKPKTPQKEPGPKCEALALDQDDEAVLLRASEPTNQTVEEPQTSEISHVDLEPEAHLQAESLRHCGYEEETPNEIPSQCEENIERIIESSEVEIHHEEEPIISPTAWVENGKQDITSSETATELASLTNQAEVGSSGSRVRHSLSQMLLEETSESDIIEWGNAENPPSMVFHKDAPKGLKRLLKFARKNKGEANVAGASPYTSEGEDDGDECRGLGRKNSDNLLKKAALNATHHGQYGISSDGYDKNLADSEPLSARSNASNSSFQSSSSATSKASRSFFSLSAFRGNKATDTKLR